MTPDECKLHLVTVNTSDTSSHIHDIALPHITLVQRFQTSQTETLYWKGSTHEPIKENLLPHLPDGI